MLAPVCVRPLEWHSGQWERGPRTFSLLRSHGSQPSPLSFPGPVSSPAGGVLAAMTASGHIWH